MGGVFFFICLFMMGPNFFYTGKGSTSLFPVMFCHVLSAASVQG